MYFCCKDQNRRILHDYDKIKNSVLLLTYTFCVAGNLETLPHFDYTINLEIMFLEVRIIPKTALKQ